MQNEQIHRSSDRRRLRMVELIAFPLRTMLVLVPLWLTYWLFQRFSAGDVSGLYDFTIWLTVGLALLSVARTVSGMRGLPSGSVFGSADHSGRFLSNLRRPFAAFREHFVAVHFSDPLPDGDLKVLRRLELFLLTPLRILVGGLFFWIGNSIVTGILVNGIGSALLFNILWVTIVMLYVIYVLSQAFVSIFARGETSFAEALRVREWFRRVRRKFIL